MKIDDYIMYVDMDGVLAGFDEKVKEVFGKSMQSMPKKELWTGIKRYNDTVAPWFYSLPMREDAEALWKFVSDNFGRVEILTATGSTPRDAAGQKRKWIGEHFGWDVKVNAVGSSSEKAAFATPNSILIDDRGKSIDPFIDAGGIGILHESTAKTISIIRPMMEDWKS